jgi:hypothetical protein
VVDVHVEAGPVVVIVAVILPGVLDVLVLVQLAGMLVVGVVLHADGMYVPSSPPGVAVGPDMNLVSGVHHLVSAGHDRVSCSHRTGWRGRPACWSPWRT